MNEALKQATAAGFPPLGVWKMMSPATVSVMVKKEIAMRDTLDFVTPMELQVIYCVVSAANNCEMCLSFHSLGLKKGEAISDADLTVLRSGGIPETEFLANGHGRLKSISFAAKYCIAHKGITSPRAQASSEDGLRWPGARGDNLLLRPHPREQHAHGQPHRAKLPGREMLRGVGPFGERASPRGGLTDLATKPCTLISRPTHVLRHGERHDCTECSPKHLAAERLNAFAHQNTWERQNGGGCGQRPPGWLSTRCI